MPSAPRCAGRAVHSIIGLLMHWTERRGQQFLGKYCNYKTNCPAAGLAGEQGGWRGTAQVRRAPGLPTDVRQLEAPCAAGSREFGLEKADAGSALCARHKALNTRLLLLCRASRPPAPLRLCTAPPRSQSRSSSQGGRAPLRLARAL